MSNFFLGIIALSVLALVCALIYVLFELKDTIRSLKEFIGKTDASLQPTLEELERALKSMRHITDNFGIVTDDVRILSGSIKEVGQNVQQVSRSIKDVTKVCTLNVSGLRAGAKAALSVLIKGLFSKNNMLNRR